MISRPALRTLDVINCRYLRHSLIKRSLPWVLNRNKSALLRPQSPKNAWQFQNRRTLGAPATPGLEAEATRHLEVEQLEVVGASEEVGVGQTEGKKSDVQNGRMSITLAPGFDLD